MKSDPNLRRTWNGVGFVAGLLLTTGLVVLTPGCGSDAPPAPVVPATPSVEATAAPASKAKGKRNVEAFDDLRERRAKRRLAAQGQG